MMSVSKRSATRRLSLLSGSSLAAAWLIAGLGAVSLAPGQAAAAECDPPGQSGTKTCTGTLPDITYPTTTGALTLQLANDLVVTTGGLEVTAPGANNVTINRTNTPAVASDPIITNTSGAGISVVAGTGLISVNLTDPAATSGPGIAITGTTHGVRLQNDGGSVSCGLFCFTNNSPTFTMTNGSITAGASGIGVEVVNTNTAAGGVTLNIGGEVSGGVGVRAETNGTGAASVNINSGAQLSGGTTGLSTSAGGSGATTVTVTGAQVSGGDAGMRIASAGAGAFTITLNSDASVIGGASGAIVLDRGAASGGAATVTNNSSTIGSAGDLDALAIQVTGGTGAFTYNGGRNGICVFGCIPPESGDLFGRFDINSTGATAINLAGTGRWLTAGESFLGDGATTLTQFTDALISVSEGGGETTLDFGSGDDFFLQRGLLILGGGAEGAATLTIRDLEEWENRGTVLFGASADNTTSDGVPNDRIVMVSGDTPSLFNASGNSVFHMDVDLGGAAQPDCSAAVSADCFDIRGGATGGATTIILNSAGGGTTSANPGIVLIDGSSQADDFVLSPLSTNWVEHDNSADGVIDTGLFFYDLAYDAENQRHVLVGMAGDEALQLPLLGLAAQTIWSSSTNGWFERQIDLRDSLPAGGGMSPGVWLKVNSNYTRRDLHQGQEAFGTLFEANNGYRQRTTNVVGGVDLVHLMGPGAALVAGITGGVLQSDVEFRVSPSEIALEGYSVGAYASYLMGPFFIDAIVNSNTLDVEYEMPSLGATGVSTTTELESLGGRVEAGFRLPVNDGAAFVEPLVGLAYVKSDLGDLPLPGGIVSGDDFVSMAASLGARVSGDLVMDAFTIKFGFTGRVWEEFEGENAVTLNGGALADDFSGTLGDVGLDLGLMMGPMSAFVSYAVKFKEDYQSRDAAIGVRYQW